MIPLSAEDARKLQSESIPRLIEEVFNDCVFSIEFNALRGNSSCSVAAFPLVAREAAHDRLKELGYDVWLDGTTIQIRWHKE